jgi:hypothetical protein
MNPTDDNLEDDLPGPPPTLLSWSDLEPLPFLSKLNLLDNTIAACQSFKALTDSSSYQQCMQTTPLRKMRYWVVRLVARTSLDAMESLKECTYLRQELEKLLMLVKLLHNEIEKEKELGAKPVRMVQVLVVLGEKVEEVYERWEFAIQMTQLRAVEVARVDTGFEIKLILW